MELKESNIDTGVNSFDLSNNHMENKINDDSSMDIKINEKSVEEKFSNIQNKIVHGVDMVEDKTNIIFSQGNKGDNILYEIIYLFMNRFSTNRYG